MREYVKNYVKDKFLHYNFDDYDIIEEDGNDILIVDIGYQYIPAHITCKDLKNPDVIAGKLYRNLIK